MLVADLDGGLLPFSQVRVRARELLTVPLPGAHVLIIENERCIHQLPTVANAVAVLGAGLNLSWMRAPWLTAKNVAYWGDMDTWGLTMLARAKGFQPTLMPLLMNKKTFDTFAGEKAVQEPQPAESVPIAGLTSEERIFYFALLDHVEGRLEQEFLPDNVVHSSIEHWLARA